MSAHAFGASRAVAASVQLWTRRWASTVLYVHKGDALPAARVVVIAVPVIILGGLWWMLRRRGR
jgi:branched-subunit amino acid ABC-type transport system permease component